MPAPSMPSSLKRRPAASTMRCLVACLWSLPYRTAILSGRRTALASSYCIMVVLLYYERNAKLKERSDDDGRRTYGCGFEHDVGDRADAHHRGRRRGVRLPSGL